MKSRGLSSSQRARGLWWMLVALAILLASSPSHALYREGTLWPKSADGITRIPVCFIFSGELTNDEDTRERALVKEVLTATWGRWMKIEFTGFGTCSNPPANATLAIALKACNCGGAGDIPDQSKHAPYHRGFQGSNTPTWGWLGIDGVSDRRARAVIIHEVGHGLSFEHEQSRPDSSGFCPDGDTTLAGTIVTSEYDDIGIMNYCGPGAYPSRLDIQGAQTLYGTSAAGLWLNALPAISHVPLL